MRQRGIFVVLMVLGLLTVGLSAQVVLAQSGTTATGASAQGTGTPASNVVSLGAGQSVSIPAWWWCLDFSKPFPTSVTGPKGMASQNVTNVLNAAKTVNPNNGDPYQTQLAVWYALDGKWHDQGSAGHALAQQIVNAAGISGSAGAATATAGAGNNLGNLMANGGLTVSVQNFQAYQDKAGVPSYHGTGNIVVQNTTNQTVSFALDGAIFQPTTSGSQTLVAQIASTGKPQVMGTTTAAPTTAAVAPTSSATVAPTTAATVAPTSSVAAVRTSTATAVARATPATLPTTGAGDSNGWMFVLLLLGALTLFAGFGLGARRAQR